MQEKLKSFGAKLKGIGAKMSKKVRIALGCLLAVLLVGGIAFAVYANTRPYAVLFTGLSTEEITGYFARGGEASELLAALEARLRDLPRGVEELRLRAAERPSISVQELRLPAVTCRTRRCVGHTIAEKYAAMYDFYSECIRLGCVLSNEPIFTVSDRRDYLDGYIGDQPYPYWVCVPVRTEKAPADAETLPECRALSVLYYGDYSGIDGAWLALGREVKARGLMPAGFPRVLGIVAPYTGREIETRRYCSRIVLPVEG